MAKYAGLIGFAIQKETRPGVWQEDIIERNYYGDIIKSMGRQQDSDEVNTNFNIDNKISIVADPFAYENFSAMRYIHWLGSKWIIKSIDINYPRLNLYIGGVYNEQTLRTP